MQLAYAGWHLRLPAVSSFANFYAHLGSVCDLAEDFLFHIYLLVLDCRDKQSPTLQGLSKEEFLKRASEWYDKSYLRIYENYHSKGKGSPLHLPARQDILSEYLERHDSWKKYKSCARLLREYRNVVVHDHLIGVVRTHLGDLVPKKEKIQNYRRHFAIEKANSDSAVLNSDFILMQEQMIGDFAELQVRLNDLWHKPIEDLRALLFKELNPKLLAKYDLTILLPAGAVRGTRPI